MRDGRPLKAPIREKRHDGKGSRGGQRPFRLSVLFGLVFALAAIKPESVEAGDGCDALAELLIDIAIAGQNLSNEKSETKKKVYRVKLEHAVARWHDWNNGQATTRKNWKEIERFVALHNHLLNANGDFANENRGSYLSTSTRSSGSPAVTALLKEAGCTTRNRAMKNPSLADGQSGEGFFDAIAAKTRLAFSNNSAGSGKYLSYRGIKDGWVFLLLATALSATAGIFFIAKRESRRSPRFDVTIETNVVVANAMQKICIENISATGAKFKPDLGLTAGAEVSVILEEKLVPAEVRWSNGGFVGVMFKSPVKERYLKRIVKTA